MFRIVWAQRFDLLQLATHLSRKLVLGLGRRAPDLLRRLTMRDLRLLVLCYSPMTTHVFVCAMRARCRTTPEHRCNTWVGGLLVTLRSLTPDKSQHLACFADDTLVHVLNLAVQAFMASCWCCLFGQVPDSQRHQFSKITVADASRAARKLRQKYGAAASMCSVAAECIS